MVKERRERPRARIPAQSCWALRAWPSWELARFSQPSAPHAPSADCSRPVHPSWPLRLPFRGGSPQDSFRPLQQDGRICKEISGVPFPVTGLESGTGRQAHPQARHRSCWRRFPPETRLEVDSFELASLHTESSVHCRSSPMMSRFPRQHLLAGAGVERLFGALSTGLTSQWMLGWRNLS